MTRSLLLRAANALLSGPTYAVVTRIPAVDPPGPIAYQNALSAEFVLGGRS